MTREIKADIASLDEGGDFKTQASAPTNPVSGREKLYFRAGSLRALTSSGTERNVEGPQKVTDNDSTGSVTVLINTNYWHPGLDIQPADTYTVNVGGALVTAGNFIVQGTLISNGDTFVL